MGQPLLAIQAGRGTTARRVATPRERCAHPEVVSLRVPRPWTVSRDRRRETPRTVPLWGGGIHDVPSYASSLGRPPACTDRPLSRQLTPRATRRVFATTPTFLPRVRPGAPSLLASIRVRRVPIPPATGRRKPRKRGNVTSQADLSAAQFERQRRSDALAIADAFEMLAENEDGDGKKGIKPFTVLKILKGGGKIMDPDCFWENYAQICGGVGSLLSREQFQQLMHERLDKARAAKSAPATPRKQQHAHRPESAGEQQQRDGSYNRNDRDLISLEHKLKLTRNVGALREKRAMRKQALSVNSTSEMLARERSAAKEKKRHPKRFLNDADDGSHIKSGPSNPGGARLGGSDSDEEGVSSPTAQQEIEDPDSLPPPEAGSMWMTEALEQHSAIHSIYKQVAHMREDAARFLPSELLPQDPRNRTLQGQAAIAAEQEAWQSKQTGQPARQQTAMIVLDSFAEMFC